MWFMVNKSVCTRRELEEFTVGDVQVKRNIEVKPVVISATIDDVILMLVNQNFVPVIDDRKMFIGIITRSDVLRYCHSKLAKPEEMQGI